MVSRRSFLEFAIASATLSSCSEEEGDACLTESTGANQTSAAPTTAANSTASERLVFLGTQGGPSFGLTRAESAAALVIGSQIYLVDCGYGALRGLVAANINYLNIAKFFLTHLHNDHVSDVAAVLGHQWTRSRKDPTTVYGPYGTDALVQAAIAFNAADARIRTADEGRTLLPADLFSGVVVDATATPLTVYEDEFVTVQSIENHHFPEETKALIPDRSLAYRFNSATRSIVFSGDTAYSDRLIELARDADILVCEGIDVIATRANFDAQVAAGAFGDNPEGVWDHIVGTHTSLADVGKLATAANVKTLVVNHLVPGGLNPSQTDQTYIDQIAPNFSGTIIISADQMVL